MMLARAVVACGLGLAFGLALVLGPGGAARAAAAPVPTRIALIGGTSTEAPGRHEYAAGIERLAALLQAWSRGRGGRPLQVDRYPGGWPDDERVLRHVRTLVLYADGEARHPLRDAGRRRVFDELMRRGAGFVALHQASTVPADGDAIGLQAALGGARIGFHDRTTEHATLEPASAAHPVLRGVRPYAHRDEFYPTLRYAAQGVLPVISATLHVQVREGRSVVEDLPERATVAWAYERPGGGRSFGYTGAHYAEAFDEPMLRRLLLNAMLWTADLEPPAADDVAAVGATAAAAMRPRAAARSSASPDDVTTFHRDALRSGWNRRETVLTPAAVSGGGFGPTWSSPPLAGDDAQPARLYASPLYVERLAVTAGPHRGETYAAVLAASSNGEVVAVNAARAGDLAPGRILWRTRLAPPCRLQPAPLDGVATGVLSTPVIDVPRQRLYVTHCDPHQRWQAWALDLGSGAVLPGWPVRLDEAALNAANRNAGPAPVPPRRRFDFRVQRGALNLSPDGRRLYVVFGETETGWLVSVDTERARIASAFAVAAMPHRGSGGLWGAGGPAVDDDGHVHVVTGTGFEGYKDQPHDWTQSLLKLADDARDGLRLAGTYTPFNHCSTAAADIDLGSGGAMLLPTPGPRLLVIGGKQGNAYLLDRDRLPGRLDRRPPCSDDPTTDGSLLPPEPQPHFGRRGPLNVFGPYSERDAALDLARARSVPAAFRGDDDRWSIYLTGNTRAAPGSAVAVPPSLVRLTVDESGVAPHLRVERAQPDAVFGNPGSPLVSSNGPRDAIVWVLDENAPRSAALAGARPPAPVLHAYDALTLAPLWRSEPGALRTSGKYNEPLVVRGQVIVGTDRLQAFGLGAAAPGARRLQPLPAGAGAAEIYAARCATCHEQAQGNVPPRSLIAQHPVERIAAALGTGAMRVHAEGLEGAQIDALARFLREGAAR